MSDLSIVPPRCFQGVVPAIIATCSKDGVPNVTYLSQVHFLDAKRVALSCQFFNKTRKNVGENPYASVQLYDPLTLEAYELDLRFDHEEKTGPLFDEMAVRIQAIASHTGMKGIFRLLSADVYDVLEVRRVEAHLEPISDPLPRPFAPGPAERRTEIRALQVVSDAVNRATDLEGLLGTFLGALRDELGFAHSMLLMPDEATGKLFAVASTGYDDAGLTGVGAEVALGEGLVGTVAQERKVVRVAGLKGDLRYARTIRRETESAGPVAAEIPLPGLPDAQSHLAIPLQVQERLVGVLAIESRNALEFDDWHEAFLNIVGNQAAIAIARFVDDDEGETRADPERPSLAAAVTRKRTFRFYRADDSVFVDGEYLIKNVAARILWRLLTSFTSAKRQDFSNRELRLDPWLGLPPIKDNLESRLILLRKRLEQKCPDVRIPPRTRGHFRLEADCAIELVEA